MQPTRETPTPSTLATTWPTEAELDEFDGWTARMPTPRAISVVARQVAAREAAARTEGRTEVTADAVRKIRDRAHAERALKLQQAEAEVARLRAEVAELRDSRNYWKWVHGLASDETRAEVAGR